MFEQWLDTNPNVTNRDVIETLRSEAFGKNVVADEYIKASKNIKEGQWYILENKLALLSFHLMKKGLVACLYQTGSAAPYAVAV